MLQCPCDIIGQIALLQLQNHARMQTGAARMGTAEATEKLRGDIADALEGFPYRLDAIA